MNTIIYYTNNLLEENIFTKCRDKLIEAAGDIPIISVSQKPIELGTNICVGEIGSNWLSLYKQLLIGAEAATTENICTAEHDCMYTHEHFSWTPPKNDVFYYNLNCYLVEWGGNHPELNGMYSTYWKRRLALSQMICNRELLIKSIKERLVLLDGATRLTREMIGIGEFGVTNERMVRKAQEAARSGKPIQLQSYIKDYLEKYTSETFKTETPNLDIRHNKNFTGPKRGKNRTFNLPYWGEFKRIMENGTISKT